MQHFQQVETVILPFSLCICILDEEMTFLTQLLKKKQCTHLVRCFYFTGNTCITLAISGKVSLPEVLQLLKNESLNCTEIELLKIEFF